AERGLLTIGGRTPDASLAGRLYTDIQRNGENSPFIQVGPRKYALREWCQTPPKPEPPQSKLKEALMKLSYDRLREKVYSSIMSLSEEFRGVFIKELIAGMRTAGANVTNHLLLLGVHSGSTEAASASDIALLLRYYRINHPKTFDEAVAIIEKFSEMTDLLCEQEAEPQEALSRVDRFRSKLFSAREDKF
ncbi:MAG: winged helix-turn-helix domain-containing protein, partial [Blastocatellia bacterium]|nr:winged helix-turn-helix domain-containing protein [Blastocatellia bacterium]